MCWTLDIGWLDLGCVLYAGDGGDGHNRRARDNGRTHGGMEWNGIGAEWMQIVEKNDGMVILIRHDEGKKAGRQTDRRAAAVGGWVFSHRGRGGVQKKKKEKRTTQRQNG
ncbi:hypothetical protein M413DRAFT_194880 [Hebeloma cylindrosporum]|uniref:Uncharacterized protein n=1 Tax=Hebeloma cylindrosporum TaxID=76867 RepID=A0A0C3C7Y5_HEBCY|nr:hypothetical protein M413DRAFT_194880 [Hebeloma cylindrosporum h7]